MEIKYWTFPKPPPFFEWYYYMGYNRAVGEKTFAPLFEKDGIYYPYDEIHQIYINTPMFIPTEKHKKTRRQLREEQDYD